jgi:hypothetical protein
VTVAIGWLLRRVGGQGISLTTAQYLSPAATVPVLDLPPRSLSWWRLSRRAAAASVVAALLLTLTAGVSVATADPGDPVPYPRPMAPDPPRVAPIGGARASSSTPQGEDAGMGQPLAGARNRTAATVPVWAYDGIFLPTAMFGKQITVHLPGEMALAPAAWDGAGGGTYSSPDVDYQIITRGSGADVVVHRKTIFSASDYAIGVRLPAGMHLAPAGGAVAVATDPTPGHPAQTVGTFTISGATDATGAPIPVTVGVGPGFPNQSNIVLDVGEANLLAFPVQFTLGYQPAS